MMVIHYHANDPQVKTLLGSKPTATEKCDDVDMTNQHIGETETAVRVVLSGIKATDTPFSETDVWHTKVNIISA